MAFGDYRNPYDPFKRYCQDIDRKVKGSSITRRMLSGYYDCFKDPCVWPLVTFGFLGFSVIFGALVSTWVVFLLFVISRFADYFTTQMGLAFGAVETNPLSEARELTNFWPMFFLFVIIFGGLTWIAHSVGSNHLVPFGFCEGEKIYHLNWVAILVDLPMLGWILLSFAAAINNIFVMSVGNEGNPEAAATIAFMIMFFLCVLVVVLNWRYQILF